MTSPVQKGVLSSSPEGDDGFVTADRRARCPRARLFAWLMRLAPPPPCLVNLFTRRGSGTLKEKASSFLRLTDKETTRCGRRNNVTTGHRAVAIVARVTYFLTTVTRHSRRFTQRPTEGAERQQQQQPFHASRLFHTSKERREVDGNFTPTQRW